MAELGAAAARRLSRPSWLTAPVALGLAVVAFWLAAALTADLWGLADPLRMVARRLQAPSADHWLGTDALGRDVLSRTLNGARFSLLIAAVVVGAAVVLGSFLGALAGFLGGWVDTVVMRLVDIVLAFPPVLLAMAVAATLGPGLENAAVALIAVWWPVYARLMRGQVLEVRTREHVEAAIACGVRPVRLLWKHILSLCWTPVLINATMDVGQVILLAAALSFIGLGATPPTPEWGAMISEGATQFYSWWIALGPGTAILTIVLGFNFLGDGLRDVLDTRSVR
jgi:peptide/nickel transport system permease protein